MKRTDTSGWPCTIARSVDVLGDHWNLLLIRQACLGTRRFDDFQRALGIGRNILTVRLNRLVDEGMLEPLVLHHTACGHDMHAVVTCSVCAKPIDGREVRAKAGPGYPKPARSRRPEKAIGSPVGERRQLQLGTQSQAVRGSFGRPRTISPRMLRCTWDDPA
jgi:hypothetical protein